MRACLLSVMPVLLLCAMPLVGCVGWSPGGVDYNQLDLVARTLHQRARRTGNMSQEQVRSLVADNTEKDRYSCLPPAAAVLAAPQHVTEARRIDGSMPHYGVFNGPMRYRVGMRNVGLRSNVWLVSLNIALRMPAADEVLELPDCQLRDVLEGPVRCEGTPYEQAPGTDACPASGNFEAAATPHNTRALLAYWSNAVEGYFNRDAAHDQLPVRYDFHFFAESDPQASRRPVDLLLTLHPDCARQPYFQGLRSGWSVPILAHEVAHFLGLLDEYEALSGVFAFYPKTPFEGSETSRMGLSMKRDTHFYPLHHYLIVRRYFCDLDRPDPFSQTLMP